MDFWMIFGWFLDDFFFVFLVGVDKLEIESKLLKVDVVFI
jgi:hypothetical protein